MILVRSGLIVLSISCFLPCLLTFRNPLGYPNPSGYLYIFTTNSLLLIVLETDQSGPSLATRIGRLNSTFRSRRDKQSRVLPYSKTQLDSN